MSPTSPPLPLPLRRRAAAWLACGPVGHAYAGVADWAELLGKHWFRLAGLRWRSSSRRRQRGAGA